MSDKYNVTEELYNSYVGKFGGVTEYTLTYEQFKTCLNRATISMFAGKESSKEPTSYIVVAQPGAGKTALSSYQERRHMKNTNEELLHIDPDRVAIYHQNRERITNEIPNNSYLEFQKFVSPTLNEVIRPMAVEKRISMLTEGTFADTKGYLNIINNQLNNRYNVVINVMAVNEFESLLSCYERQQINIENELLPRITTKANHDRSYMKIFETLTEVENLENDNVKIKIFRRGKTEKEDPILVYESGDGRYSSSMEALSEERLRNLKQLIANKETYLKRIEALRERIEKTYEAGMQSKEVYDVQIGQLEAIRKDFEMQIRGQEVIRY